MPISLTSWNAAPHFPPAPEAAQHEAIRTVGELIVERGVTRGAPDAHRHVIQGARDVARHGEPYDLTRAVALIDANNERITQLKRAAAEIPGARGIARVKVLEDLLIRSIGQRTLLLQLQLQRLSGSVGLRNRIPRTQEGDPSRYPPLPLRDQADFVSALLTNRHNLDSRMSRTDQDQMALGMLDAVRNGEPRDLGAESRRIKQLNALFRAVHANAIRQGHADSSCVQWLNVVLGRLRGMEVMLETYTYFRLRSSEAYVGEQPSHEAIRPTGADLN